MKKTLEDILSPDKEPAAMSLGTADDDWLSRANSLIINFKELIKMAQELRGMAPGAQEPASSGNMVTAAPQLDKTLVLKFLDNMINSGLGDATISQIIERANPLTIKKIRGMIADA